MMDTQNSIDEACARLRTVLHETRGLSRRAFLDALGKAAAGSAFLTQLADMAFAADADQAVTTLVYGGAWKQAIIAAYGNPFTKKTGIPVRYQEPYTFAKVRAMHEAHAQQIDVVLLTGAEVIIAERMKMATPVDWSIVDRSALSDVQVRTPGSIGGQSQSMLVCYSKKKWPGGEHPSSWADLWDVKKFPGRRALRRDATWTIEAALMADGATEDKFYPIDLDRAFRSLDRIKPHVKTWWSDNSLSQQLMEQEEVDLIMMANGRATQSIVEHKAPFEMVWNGALWDGPTSQGWIVPVGCPNPTGGMKFLDVVGRAEPQAAFARLLYYSPQNSRAFDFIDPALAKMLPSYPDNAKIAHQVKYDWWADHRAEANRRFESWLQS